MSPLQPLYLCPHYNLCTYVPITTYVLMSPLQHLYLCPHYNICTYVPITTSVLMSPLQHLYLCPHYNLCTYVPITTSVLMSPLQHLYLCPHYNICTYVPITTSVLRPRYNICTYVPTITSVLMSPYLEIAHTVQRLAGQVLRSQPLEQDSRGSPPLCRCPWSSHTPDFRTGTLTAPCWAPGIIGPALGLVGPVSVSHDSVR